jgi:hypothetical protein
MISVKEWKRRLQRLGYPTHPRAERRTPHGFVARHGSRNPSSLGTIKNISDSGLYLLTTERWPVDDLVLLTIQGEGSPEVVSELQITIHVRVVRHGEDGMGLSFVLPAGLDQNLWGVLVRNAVVLTAPKDVLATFRILRAFLFICRLCGEKAEESILLFGGVLDESRTENALNIALRTEKLLASKPDADRMIADPKIVASILRDGSWAEDDLLRQLWSGLLAGSCSSEKRSNANQKFIDVMVHMTPAQAQIFVASCERALKLISNNGDMATTPIVFTPEEMIEVTGMYDLTRIATDIAYLFYSELIVKNHDFTSYLPTERFSITPSALGLELYRHCRGI